MSKKDGITSFVACQYSKRAISVRLEYWVIVFAAAAFAVFNSAALFAVVFLPAALNCSTSASVLAVMPLAFPLSLILVSRFQYTFISND